MAAVTFSDHEGFQKTVLMASAGGAAAGLAMYGLAAVGIPVSVSMVPLACAAAAGAACGKNWKTRILYGVLGGAAGSLAPVFQYSGSTIFGLASAGVGVGSLFAYFRQREASGGVEAGKSRMGRAATLAAAALTAVALVAGKAVVDAFTARGILESLMPATLAAMASTAVIGFFLSLGSAGAHVVRDPDPVEGLYARMLPEIRGDLKALSERAMTNYRRCAEILANSEAGYARTQLSKSLSDVTLRILELGRRWQAIDRELGDRAESEANQRLAELRTLKTTLRDEAAKRQLGGAENAVMAELQQIDRIRRGRERVIARLHGEMALLDRSRFALLGLKTSDAHLRAAELSALSESLSTVAREMDCEAEAVDEIISKVIDVKDGSASRTADAVMDRIAEIQPPAATAEPAPIASVAAPAEKAKA